MWDLEECCIECRYADGARRAVGYESTVCGARDTGCSATRLERYRYRRGWKRNDVVGDRKQLPNSVVSGQTGTDGRQGQVNSVEGVHG